MVVGKLLFGAFLLFGSGNAFPSVPTTGASVGNRLWLDNNRNGEQGKYDDNMPVPVNVRLEMCLGGNYILMFEQEFLGTYFYGGLPPAQYRLVFGKPFPFARVPKGLSPFPGLDSDANEEDGTTDCFDLAPGQHRDDIDAGYYRMASVGEEMWLDLNRDGLQDAGEPRLTTPVKVTLVDCEDGTQVRQRWFTGYYLFRGLKAGVYRVTFGLPQGLGRTRYLDNPQYGRVNSDVMDNGSTECFDVADGQRKRDVDAGYTLEQR